MSTRYEEENVFDKRNVDIDVYGTDREHLHRLLLTMTLKKKTTWAIRKQIVEFVVRWICRSNGRC